MTRRNRPIELHDGPEHRAIPLDQVELRTPEDSDEYVLTGYASTFQEYDMYGGPSQYGWVERIDPGAFDKTLREKPDLHLLINHAGMPLARTKSGTLSLSTDDHGLKVEARLDKRDPEVQSLAVKMERGDMDEMSFAFRVKAQEWRAAPGYEEIDDQSYRTITEVSLHKGDVSVVNWGANPTTSAGIRSASDILRELVEIDDETLTELRSEEDLVKLAAAKIEKLAKPVEVEEERDEEAAEVTEEREEEHEHIHVKIDNLVSTSVRIEDILEALAHADAEVVETFRELILGAEERDEEEIEDSVEETVEETEVEPEPRGMSLNDALAVEGILPDAEARLSLAAALALSE